jgi:hypothetical protein
VLAKRNRSQLSTFRDFLKFFGFLEKMNSNSVNQNTKETNDIPIEELKDGYMKHQRRKQRQCGYQRKHMEKKKDEVNQLKNQVQQLNEQNAKLKLYYQMFELLRLQNPQIADQLTNQVLLQNKISAPHVELPTQISTPTPLGSHFSSAWPMVSMK